jgi:hypothetical protein
MTRMPRPPPPQLALSITGIADLVGHAGRTSSMSSGSTSVAGITGTPASMAALRATPCCRAAHGIGGRADEDDAGGVAGIDEFRAFGQEAVARMDGVGAAFLATRMISSMDR